MTDTGIAASEVLSMFPTLVWKLQLERTQHEAMDVTLAAALERLRRDRPALAPGEGWQSRQDLHELAAFGGLVSCIRRAGAGVLRFLHIGPHAFEVTGCWANVLASGASHRLHSHPNNFLSGVYYLRTSAGADTINFHDPRSQTAIIRPPVTALTVHNTDQVVVRVSNGMLLLFPAYLQHSVDANTSGHERISISFNLMLSDFTGQLSKPLWSAPDND